MARPSAHLLFGIVSAWALAAACSAAGPGSTFGGGSGSGAGDSGGAGGGPGTTGGGSNDGAGGLAVSGGGGSVGSGTGVVCNHDPNVDGDHDGWTGAQGDCNDCDPNVNPGAIDVLHSVDGGPPTWGDEDCDGKPGDTGAPCDQGLALDDVDPNDAAKAIELCRKAAPNDRKWGVLSAAYVRADGSPFAAPGVQVGLRSDFGPNVKVQAGASMLALSSGHARTIGEPDACGMLSCKENAVGTPPPGFPQDNPDCPPSKIIVDDVAFEVKLRAPTNATGYSFSFKFYSFEFPEWVCNDYNDQFIALVSPPPQGSVNGNVSFDDNHKPVSVNLGFFDVCDPSNPGAFASKCKQVNCPSLPNPYCPLGPGEMAGTGFDVWKKSGPAGGTGWLSTQAPVKGGDEISIRFAIWDAGNQQYDSTALVDDFKWIADAGSVAVTTKPIPNPK
jgi:hypothetical protein